MQPDDPRQHEWYALLLAGIATVAGAIWKGFFALRRDVRDDRSGAAHSGIVEELRKEVRRLSDMVTELGKKLDEESERRRNVEAENHALRLRVAHLERLVEGAL